MEGSGNAASSKAQCVIITSLAWQKKHRYLRDSPHEGELITEPTGASLKQLGEEWGNGRVRRTETDYRIEAQK